MTLTIIKNILHFQQTNSCLTSIRYKDKKLTKIFIIVSQINDKKYVIQKILHKFMPRLNQILTELK